MPAKRDPGKRILVTSLLGVVAVMLGWGGVGQTSEHAPQKPKPRPVEIDQVPATILMLAPGEETTVALGWAMGTGRVPLYYFSDDALPEEIAGQNDGAGPRYEQAGISLAMDINARKDVATQLRSLDYADHENPRRKLSTYCAVDVSVGEDVPPGIYRRYVHNISGTARMMTLSAELVIIVQAE